MTAAGCAMEAIGRGLISHPDNATLREGLAKGTINPARFCDGVRRIVFGLLARLTAEARGMTTSSSVSKRLRDAANRRSKRAGDRTWRALQSSAADRACGALVPLDASLCERVALADADLMLAIDALTMDQPQSIEFAIMQPLAIGSAYEQTLALVPHVRPEADHPERFVLRPLRHSRRRTQGSFYTPDALVQHVLAQTLEPATQVSANCAARTPETLLDLRLCDPACGTGNFLVAAARTLAAAIDRRECPNAMRSVIERCMYGVDIDPLAIDLCRCILWLEAGDPDFDPAILHRNIRRGNALLGAAPNDACNAEHARLLADAWCIALLPDAQGLRATPAMLREIESAPHATPQSLRDAIRELARDHAFFHWQLEYPEIFAPTRGGFDVVVGNPPFLNQLESDTAVSRGAAAILRERTGGEVRGYADAASAFLHLASEITRPGGRFALVQPQSLLAARDACGVRRAILRRASIESLWIANEHLFEAGVFTCAPAFRVDGPRCTSVLRSAGADFEALPALSIDNQALLEDATWSRLIADSHDVPALSFTHARVIGDFATATADFRDQYYGLAGCIVEDENLTSAQRRDHAAFPRLITTGLVDLAVNHWGRRPTRVHKRRWLAPRIDRRRLERMTDLGAWLTSRLVPKVLLATQTRILEVVVDERGEFVPLVPLITIVPHDASDLCRIAAAIASPVCTAIAVRDFSGTALSADAIKLAASQVLPLPCPVSSTLWESAARQFQQASDPARQAHERWGMLRRMALLLVQGHDVEQAQREQLLEWWNGRAFKPSRGAAHAPSDPAPVSSCSPATPARTPAA